MSEQERRGRASSRIPKAAQEAAFRALVNGTPAARRRRAELLGLAAQAARMHLALRNVLALSHRIAKRDPENAGHLRRFCASAGVVPSILRGGAP